MIVTHIYIANYKLLITKFLVLFSSVVYRMLSFRPRPLVFVIRYVDLEVGLLISNIFMNKIYAESVS